MLSPKGAEGGPEGRGDLLALDCAYSLRQIRDRGLEHVVDQHDLDGFFNHVWYVQPLLGAGSDGSGDPPLGPSRATPISSRHTVIEAPVGRMRMLRRLTAVNFALSQLVLFARLWRLIRRRPIGVLAVADPFYLGLMGLALSRINRLPLVVRVNANYDATYEAGRTPAYPRLIRSHRLEVLIARLVFSRAELVTVGSDDNLRYVIDAGGVADRVKMVPSGDMIAAAHLQEPGERPPIPAETGMAHRPFVIFVGRLEPSKHPEAALLTLAKLKTEFPEAGLVVVGDGSMRHDMERQARDLGISGEVLFAGMRDQRWIARALTSATVALCPYSGLALIEAALSGTPVVGFDVEWHAEFISSGETGVLVPYGDTKALAEAVGELFREPAARRAIAAAAREHALRHMDREDAVAVKRSLYASLCEAKRA